MATSRFTVKIRDARIADPNRTFGKELQTLIESYAGTIGAIELVPTNEELHLLGIRERVIGCLLSDGIDTGSKLTSLTEEEVLAVRGISWMSYRDIVLSLHHAGLGLRNAPPPEQALELLPISSWAYGILRACRSIVFRRIEDLVDLDVLTMRSALGSRSVDEVLKALGPRRSDFDPLLWS